MSRGAQKFFAVGLLGLLVAMALAARFLEPDAEAPDGSVASSADRGRRALQLLLESSGFQAEAWHDAPGKLPHEDALLWLPAIPSRERGTRGANKPISPVESGMLAARHYRRFLEEGGTLVLRASDDARRFLVEDLGIEAASEIERAKGSAPGLRTFRDERGETFEIDVGSGGLLCPAGAGSSARSILGSGGGDPGEDAVLAATLPVGSGRVVVLGDDAFLSNARIGAHDHALLAVRLAEEFAAGKRVLFDEYALGLWRARSPVSLLVSPSLFLATLHAFLLLALVVLRSAWVREFPRDPATSPTASPLLRARASAALLVRAGRFDLLAGFLREGMARRIERRDPSTARELRSRAAVPVGGTEGLERLHAEMTAIERGPAGPPRVG